MVLPASSYNRPNEISKRVSVSTSTMADPDDTCNDRYVTRNTLVSLLLLLFGWVTFEWTHFESSSSSVTSNPTYLPTTVFYGVGLISVILLLVVSICKWQLADSSKPTVDAASKRKPQCASFPKAASSPTRSEIDPSGTFRRHTLTQSPLGHKHMQDHQKTEDNSTALYPNSFDGHERFEEMRQCDAFERSEQPKRLSVVPQQQITTKPMTEHGVAKHETEQKNNSLQKASDRQPAEGFLYVVGSNDKGMVNTRQQPMRQEPYHTLNQKPGAEPAQLRQPLELSEQKVQEERALPSPALPQTSINQIPQALLLGTNPNFPGPPPLNSPTLILDPSQTYSRVDSFPSGGISPAGVPKPRQPNESILYWNSAAPTSMNERLNLNDLYVFHVPISELVRYFTVAENKKSLSAFYKKVLENIDIISAPVAADLIRLPVKTNCSNLEFTRALCNRILQFPVNGRNLTSMQIALACWSLAKTPQGVTTGKRQGEFNCTLILNSLAEEALCKAKLFEPLSIANLFWACGKLRYKNEKLLSQLAGVAAAQLEIFNAQNIANTYWALGTLEVGSTVLTPRLSSAPLSTTVIGTLVQKLPEFNSQAVANFIWACARLQWNVPQLLQTACYVAVQTSQGFKPQEIANFMWGVAKLGYTNGTFAIEVFSKRAAANLRLFNSQEVSNAYWALGTLEQRGTSLTPVSLSIPVATLTLGASFSATPIDSTTTSSVALPSRAASTIDLVAGRSSSATPSTKESLSDKQHHHHQLHIGVNDNLSQLMERQPHENELLSVLLQKMEHFNSQAIANFIWACGKLQWKSVELCTAFNINIRRNIRYFRPQNTANILWAFAKLRIYDSELNRILVDAAVSHLDEFNPQEIANVYWAIGTLELQESPLTPVGLDLLSAEQQQQSPICQAIKEKLPNFKPQEIANFLWACARLHWRPSDVLDVATEVALQCAGRFKPQEVGNLVWALAKLNYRHVELLNTMCDYAAINIQHFTPQNVANIYWAIGSLTFSQTLLSHDHPAPEFLNSLLQLITMFNDQELTNFLWSCGRLRWEVKEVISIVSQIVVRKAKLFRRKELLNLQWAFKKLGHHDLVEILEDAMSGGESSQQQIDDQQKIEDFSIAGQRLYDSGYG